MYFFIKKYKKETKDNKIIETDISSYEKDYYQLSLGTIYNYLLKEISYKIEELNEKEKESLTNKEDTLKLDNEIKKKEETKKELELLNDILIY